MSRKTTYSTKQSESILEYIISLGNRHVIAAEILKHFESSDTPIGKATVYRHLDKLTECGKLRKYVTDNLSSACFQYVDNSEDCHEHLHLKCEDCGELIHLQCDLLNEFSRHIHNEHAFWINVVKTTLHGKCMSCFPKLDKNQSKSSDFTDNTINRCCCI
ncbi:MAG: transcriptional repressor [Defluviitaleaceae bacterium]|nr:transcriptional repressor [Defluviitaleaceae bacterium]